MTAPRTVTAGSPLFTTEYDMALSNGEVVRVEQQLLYLGHDGQAFRLGYRESGNGRAREPFREDLVFQNPAPGAVTDVAFRALWLRVHAVSNLGIEFSVEAAPERL